MDAASAAADLAAASNPNLHHGTVSSKGKGRARRGLPADLVQVSSVPTSNPCFVLREMQRQVSLGGTDLDAGAFRNSFINS